MTPAHRDRFTGTPGSTGPGREPDASLGTTDSASPDAGEPQDTRLEVNGDSSYGSGEARAAYCHSLAQGRSRHRRGLRRQRLGVDPTGGLSVLDWLTVTGQSVLEVTAGPVFTDRTRALARVRSLLAWYPPDVERYVLAAGWQRICQLMPMAGRTAEAGDELGSRLVSAGLAEDVVWLAFALSRRWAPYAKWRGTVFRSLPVAGVLGPLLGSAAVAPGWREREDALAAACEVLLDLQRERGLPAPGGRGGSLLRPALPHGGPGSARGALRRRHRPGRRTATARGRVRRAVGRLRGRLVKPRPAAGPAGGLPGLGRCRVKVSFRNRLLRQHHSPLEHIV